MKKIYNITSGISTLILALIFIFTATSCSDDATPARSQNDIVGVWANIEGRYMHLTDDYKAYNLYVTDKDGAPAAEFEIPRAGYFYEPGYNILLYMSAESQPEVYQIVTLTADELVWCLVDNLLDEKYDGLSKSELIGEVIKQAHEGYHLDPAKFQYFTRVPESVYNEILEEFELDEEMVP